MYNPGGSKIVDRKPSDCMWRPLKPYFVTAFLQCCLFLSRMFCCSHNRYAETCKRYIPHICQSEHFFTKDNGIYDKASVNYQVGNFSSCKPVRWLHSCFQTFSGWPVIGFFVQNKGLLALVYFNCSLKRRLFHRKIVTLHVKRDRIEWNSKYCRA